VVLADDSNSRRRISVAIKVLDLAGRRCVGVKEPEPRSPVAAVRHLGEAGEPELSWARELEANDRSDIKLAARDGHASFREVQHAIGPLMAAGRPEPCR